MSGKRVADYFIVAGLPEQRELLDNGHNTNEQKTSGRSEPITDICVVIPSEGEECPPGYKVLFETTTGLLADLNHGSIRAPEVFICYRRGRDKPPLTDIGVLYEGSERVLDGCEVVYTTPYGRPANINNTKNDRIYITYRRAPETASSDTLAVTNICVIVTSKGETPPHSFCKIDKNLNKGSLMGSNVFLCYKKSMCKDYSIAYKPTVLSRYPSWNWPDIPLPEQDVAMFALPMGALLESWLEKAQQPKPVFSTFVLTGLDASKLYGAAVTFYESYSSDKLTKEESQALGLHLKKKRNVHANRAICLLSKNPFFECFKEFLNYLWRLSLSKQEFDIPIERLIHHLIWDVPYPTAERPRVMVPLPNYSDELVISLPDESPIPQSGASFSDLLKNLGPDSTVNLLSFLLLEHKIAIHSLRPAVLTGVCEAVRSLIFPFYWQCPYIPLCPLGLSEVLWAPVPFIIGLDSRYFDLYDPPPEVTCIDLDTAMVTTPPDKAHVTYKLLPKRPVKVLRTTLERIYRVMREQSMTQRVSIRGTSREQIDSLKSKAHETETAIQEAFLRFMAAMLKGYKSYLLPITSAPTARNKNVKELFDMKGFVRSRDKAYQKFYEQVMSTQSFASFIEERSFNSRDDSSLDFFDECVEKVDENYDTPQLLGVDLLKSDHTAFVPPPTPEVVDGQDPLKFTYSRFPTVLQADLFPPKDPPPESKLVQQPLGRKTFISKRSKAEIKSSLKMAGTYKTGLAASSLWAKCLINNSFSLWFIHLPSFVLVSQSPNYALRTAFHVLDKMKDYRLQATDEVCYRTMMHLCGLYELPVLAVKLLVEMRRIGLSISAATYGSYNKAVFDSEWPSGFSNARQLWKKVKNIIMGVAQFKSSITRRNRRFSRDLDSVSRDSVESSEIIEADSTLKREDVHSTASDKGYSSMSQEDLRRETKLHFAVFKNTPRLHVEKPDEFRTKVGSIIKRSVSAKTENIPSSNLDSSAGLLITTTIKGRHRNISLGGSLNLMNTTAFSEAKRKRHSSAGDHLKHPLVAIDDVDGQSGATGNLLDGQNSQTDMIAVSLDASDKLIDLNTPVVDNPAALGDPLTPTLTSSQSSDALKKSLVMKDDPLGLYSEAAVSPEVKNSTPKSLNNSLVDMETEGLSSPPPSMDIGNLFGRDSPKKSLPSIHSADNLQIKRYNLLELSPEEEKTIFARPEGQPALRKSLSLDSRNSYKEAIKSGVKSAEGTASADVNPPNQAKRDSLESKDSIDSFNSAIHSAGAPAMAQQNTAANPQQQNPGTSSYKSWVTSSLKRSANAAMKSTLVKNLMYGKTTDGPSPATGTTLAKPDPVGSMSSRESLDSIGVTVTPVNTPSKNPNDGVTSSITKIKSVSSTVASRLMSNYKLLKHTVKEYQAPSTVSAPYKQEKTTSGDNEDSISILSDQLSGISLPTSAIEEYMSTGQDTFDTTISYDGVAESFINKYMPNNSRSSEQAPVANSQSSDITDTVPSEAGGMNVLLEVILCTVTPCDHCSILLYDEDIMSGWSAQDSDLNTVCRFCEKKTVPTLHGQMKELRKNNSQSDSSKKLTDSVSAAANSKDSEQFDLCRVPYLSPLVLRKELENVLESEGDDTLTKPSFIDDHSIIYWNLIWYFKRMGVPSHLPSLLFKSKGMSQFIGELMDLQSHNLSIRVVWDNPRLYEKMYTPLYKLWKKSTERSSMVRALLTDESIKTKQFMQQLMNHVECNDIYTPLKLLMNSRRHNSRNSNLRPHSAYRDLLFLSFSYFGQKDMDHDAFDREYKLAFRRLTPADKQYLQVSDFPPTPTVMWCRKLFGSLEVS